MQKSAAQRLVFIFPLCLAGSRERAKRAAMIAPVAGDEFMTVMLADLLLVLAGYFEGGFVGFRTAVGEENDIVAFQPFVQLLGQGDGRHMALR
ncbi:hypothetical protein D3C87_1886320 [compost metagenome]